MPVQGYQLQYESLRHSFDKGRDQGRAEARAQDVVAFLEARGLAVTEAQRARILASMDSERLAGWVRKAAIIASTDELFAD